MSAKLISANLIDNRSSVQHHLTQNDIQFHQKIQKIKNKDYKQIKQKGIYYKNDNPYPNMFYFNANQYDSNLKQDIQDYILIQTCKFIQNNDKKSFAISYLHDSFFDFLAFRRFLQKWPTYFFQKLRRVYIIDGSFMVTLIQKCSYGTFYRFCDQIFKNITEQQQMKEQDQRILNQIGQTKKLKIRNQNGKQIKQYQISQDGYPYIIEAFFKRFMKDMEEYKMQGIFRKNEKSQQLLYIQNKETDYKKIYQINKSSVAMKALSNIFRNLKTPLLGYNNYQKLLESKLKMVKTQTPIQEYQIKFVKQIIAQLTALNKNIYLLFLVFLKDHVVHLKQYNKMTCYNFSVIFAPCFLWAQVQDISQLFTADLCVRFLYISFSFQQIFTSKQIQNARNKLKSLTNIQI